MAPKPTDQFGSRYERWAKECDKTKHDATCTELLKDVPQSVIKQNLEGTALAEADKSNGEERRRKTKAGVKSWWQDFVKPKPKAQRIEDQTEVFKYCSKPPCHLECLYGKRLDLLDEEPPDMVRDMIYTKAGTPYETVAYRLPDDFASGLKAAQAKVEEPPSEEEYIQMVKKKRKKKLEIMEFTGPVRIIVVDKAGFLTSYSSKRIQAAFIPFGYILIGATIMIIYFYTLTFKHHYSTNVHIITCTFAFQYCLPSSVLVKNKFSISGHFLSSKEQTRTSILLKLMALLNVFGGMYCIYLWKDGLETRLKHSIYTKHALAGFGACGLTIAEVIVHALMSQLIGVDRGRIIECYLHFISVLAIALSYYCFVTGVLDHPSLKSFIPYKHWHYWILAFAGIFALTAIFKPCLDCLFYLWTCTIRIGSIVYRFFRPRDPCTPAGAADELYKV